LIPISQPVNWFAAGDNLISPEDGSTFSGRLIHLISFDCGQVYATDHTNASEPYFMTLKNWIDQKFCSEMAGQRPGNSSADGLGY
jgi:hypothetical protein